MIAPALPIAKYICMLLLLLLLLFLLPRLDSTDCGDCGGIHSCCVCYVAPCGGIPQLTGAACYLANIVQN